MEKKIEPNSGNRPRIALALQGGGAHGAYGWGVLERLLQEDIDVVAVSGASAGALNGTALVAGLARGGREGAVECLGHLWRTVAEQSPLKSFDMDTWGNAAYEKWYTGSLEFSKLMSRYIAPLVPQLHDMRTLRRVVQNSIDLASLHRPNAVPLHISATRVANGAARLFTGYEITLDAIMASACLPDLFSVVEIDGEKYWDGGFSANPALEPLLFDDADATDLLIVQITPFMAHDVSSSVTSIMGRMSDICFNACLLRDLKALTEAQEVACRAPSATASTQALARTNIHLIEAAPDLMHRGSVSKIDTRWSKLQELRKIGHEAANAWLAANGSSLGRRSTLTEMPETVATELVGSTDNAELAEGSAAS